MKTKLCLIVFLALGSWIIQMPVCNGQVADDKKTGTHDYDVQRVYDKEGNLIYYDSTVVSTEHNDHYDAEFDSLINTWKDEDKTVDYSIRFPKDSFSYSFRLPEGFYEFAPEYKFDIEVPEFDSLLSGFEYYFSITPSDSTETNPDDKPSFEYHGEVPEIDPYLDSKKWEMERRILEFQDRIFEEYDEWEKHQGQEKEEEEEKDENKEDESPPILEKSPDPVIQINI